MNGAETETVISILAVDLLMQLWMTLQIIKMKPKITEMQREEVEENREEYAQGKDDTAIQKQEREKEGYNLGKEELNDKSIKTIKKLVLAEIVEGVVPLAYTIGFLMAYFGPNAYLTGNVLLDVWAYKPVDDINGLLRIQILFCGVDLLSVILNHFVLLKFANVNLIQAICKMIQDYWVVLSIYLVNVVVSFFTRNDVNCAMDLTLKLEWITRDGRLDLIYNATDLTDYEKNILLFNRTYP